MRRGLLRDPPTKRIKIGTRESPGTANKRNLTYKCLRPSDEIGLSYEIYPAGKKLEREEKYRLQKVRCPAPLLSGVRKTKEARHGSRPRTMSQEVKIRFRFRDARHRSGSGRKQVKVKKMSTSYDKRCRQNSYALESYFLRLITAS